MKPIAEVVPGIYIGSIAAVDVAADNGIDFVINLSCEPYNTVLPTLNILMDDTVIKFNEIELYFRKFALAVSAVEKNITNGKKILVHCRAGVNRSATAIAMYLIKIGYTYDNAIYLLTKANLRRRIPVLTNPSFRIMLKGYEQSLCFEKYVKEFTLTK